MHFCGLILGPDPEGQMARYDESREVESYIAECYSCGGEARYQPCEVCDDTGKAWTTRNPEGRWDYWRIGGRWRGVLHAEEGTLAELSYEWEHEPPKDWSGRADQALAGQVDWDRTVAEQGRTYFLVAEGVWRARENWDGHSFVADEGYEALWDSLTRGIPADSLVTIVDVHS